MEPKVGHPNPHSRELSSISRIGWVFKVVDPKVYFYRVNVFIDACGTNLQTAARFENFQTLLNHVSRLQL
ncbi:hypothetical protein MUK42_05129 [Musa troglodytarum]|uniref:Uncharacterized protein n=1 Tax=Musa troglodytarum TaxID=320322 RepID=A0A9E7GEF1_9LILI|nr:hypothetical protein MUK42_05129 [Musa troglodytarum]